MQFIDPEENHNKIDIVGLCIERRTSTLRLCNNTKLSVTICVKIHSKTSSACALLLNVNNYSLST